MVDLRLVHNHRQHNTAQGNFLDIKSSYEDFIGWLVVCVFVLQLLQELCMVLRASCFVVELKYLVYIQIYFLLLIKK